MTQVETGSIQVSVKNLWKPGDTGCNLYRNTEKGVNFLFSWRKQNKQKNKE